jgi:hypothetical protein
MSRFHARDVAASRALHASWLEIAATRGPHDSVANSVEFNLLHLEDVAANGLADCYDGIEEWLYDFYPGLNWGDESVDRLRLILADPRFEVASARILADWGFDMRAELESALEDYLLHA